MFFCKNADSNDEGKDSWGVTSTVLGKREAAKIDLSGHKRREGAGTTRSLLSYGR